MSFDIEPDGDPHGECALEINNLRKERDEARAEALVLREGFKKLRDAIEFGPFFGAEATDTVIEADKVLAQSPLAEKLAKRIEALEAVADFAKVQWPGEVCADGPDCPMWSCKANHAVAALRETGK